ncbi:MAG: quinoprotein dehydrogenase-associated putative ABC transporter substrate-binding protein [Bryobacterales bacterium]|nr:quinoprotein dehydrogenase-associated putative ABC transporter substrate-binding protein [Bryobacterales bacterium]MBV9396366.1 quinoprotein dehydrogenase-associated putative ABC transporter substrate-binding protein [Bryobacterales bacterium]
MFFRCLSLAWVCVAAMAADGRELRVCADPNNLPFSNRAGQGIENRLAELIAKDLSVPLSYAWVPQRKGFPENSLGAGLCDAAMGVPSTIDSVLPTRAYYCSTYVFVTRSDRHFNISSLNDPRLNEAKIGLHVAGDDYAPPAYLLVRRGLASRLFGFSMYGAADETNPPARLIEAVAKGDIDVAIAWGPIAGYFSKLQDVPLDVTPVSPAMFLAVPFTYSVSAGVRNGNNALQSEIDGILSRECEAIAGLLREYRIPQLKEDRAKCGLPQSAVSSSR